MSNQMNDPQLPPDLSALEARLAALTPAPPRLHRDTLLYNAGHAAASSTPRPSTLPWKLTSLAGWATAATLALLPLLTPAASKPRAIEPIAVLPDRINILTSDPSPATPPPAANLLLASLLPQSPALRERNRLLSAGLDPLPALPPSTAAPANPLPDTFQLHPLLPPLKGFPS